MTVDQMPRVRTLLHCPKCTRDKSPGLLLCWPCHNELKMHHDAGYGPWEAKLAEIERNLESDVFFQSALKDLLPRLDS